MFTSGGAHSSDSHTIWKRYFFHIRLNQSTEWRRIHEINDWNGESQILLIKNLHFISFRHMWFLASSADAWSNWSNESTLSKREICFLLPQFERQPRLTWMMQGFYFLIRLCLTWLSISYLFLLQGRTAFQSPPISSPSKSHIAARSFPSPSPRLTGAPVKRGRVTYLQRGGTQQVQLLWTGQLQSKGQMRIREISPCICILFICSAWSKENLPGWFEPQSNCRRAISRPPSCSITAAVV